MSWSNSRQSNVAISISCPLHPVSRKLHRVGRYGATYLVDWGGDPGYTALLHDRL
jgi:hypothetical protein